MAVHLFYTSKQYIANTTNGKASPDCVSCHTVFGWEQGDGVEPPTDQREWPCERAQIQTEADVLLHCLLSAQRRSDHPHLTYGILKTLFTENTYLNELCDYIIPCNT